MQHNYIHGYNTDIQAMKRITIISFILAFPLLLMAKGEDDFGVWSEIGLEKSLSKQWSIGLETEYRAQDKGRFSIGANAEYKPVKFLKIGVFYNYMHSYKPEQREEHYRKDIPDADHWNGYNLKDDFWSPRHRAGADITASVKLWRWLRLSVRERYQLTYRPVAHRTVTKYRYDRFIDGDTGLPIYQLKDEDEDDVPDYPINEVDTKDNETDHVLRSRLKLEVDKKGWKLSPFISTEAHNNLGDGMNLEKVRSAIGCGYKINKHNDISVSYILTANIHDDEDSHARMHNRVHAISLGYSHKF